MQNVSQSLAGGVAIFNLLPFSLAELANTPFALSPEAHELTQLIGDAPNKWMSVLRSSFIVHTLRPYHQNFNKRIVKTPKLYFYDIGLACALSTCVRPTN